MKISTENRIFASMPILFLGFVVGAACGSAHGWGAVLRMGIAGILGTLACIGYAGCVCSAYGLTRRTWLIVSITTGACTGAAFMMVTASLTYGLVALVVASAATYGTAKLCAYDPAIER